MQLAAVVAFVSSRRCWLFLFLGRFLRLIEKERTIWTYAKGVKHKKLDFADLNKSSRSTFVNILPRKRNGHHLTSFAALAAACFAARASSLMASGAGGGTAAEPSPPSPAAPLEGGAGGGVTTSPFIRARRLAGCETGPTLASPLFSFSLPSDEAAAALVRMGHGGFLAQAAMALFQA